jgi:hypothetical protein
MPKSRLLAAVTLLSTGIILALAQAADAQSTCDWSATTALQQQQDNERNKCGFAGAEWSSDRRAHLAWCSGVSPEAWKKAAQQRHQQIDACVAKKK